MKRLPVSECEDTRAEWGTRCKTCKQVLPARSKRFPSWRSSRLDERHVHPPEPSNWMRRVNRIQP